MKQDLLSMDRLPTLDELKEFFKRTLGQRRRLMTRLRERMENAPRLPMRPN